jgi:hypothetical protein
MHLSFKGQFLNGIEVKILALAASCWSLIAKDQVTSYGICGA